MVMVSSLGLGRGYDTSGSMGREGFEPSRAHAQRILSPQRLPFRCHHNL